MLAYLKENVNELTTIDADALCREMGSPKVLNMIMLGEAVRSGALPLGIDEIDQAMRATVKPQFAELNSKALKGNH